VDPDPDNADPDPATQIEEDPSKDQQPLKVGEVIVPTDRS
jgi:hypothetical protein